MRVQRIALPGKPAAGAGGAGSTAQACAGRSGFTEEELDRIIQMAWEDRTPFEAIATQFQLKEKDVIAVMRSHLQPSSFRLWRRRMKARRTKHATRRAANIVRFKSRQQRNTGNRAAKR